MEPKEITPIDSSTVGFEIIKSDFWFWSDKETN